jgi:hypothetical protein
MMVGYINLSGILWKWKSLIAATSKTTVDNDKSKRGDIGFPAHA